MKMMRTYFKWIHSPNLNIGDFLRNFAGGFGGQDPFGFADMFGGRQKREREIKETEDHEIVFNVKASLTDLKKGIKKAGTY